MSVREFLTELKTFPNVIRTIDRNILQHEENIKYNIGYYRKKILVLKTKYDTFTKLEQMPGIDQGVYKKIENELVFMIHYMEGVLNYLEQAAVLFSDNKVNEYDFCMDSCVHYMNSFYVMLDNSYLNEFDINDIVISNNAKQK